MLGTYPAWPTKARTCQSYWPGNSTPHPAQIHTIHVSRNFSAEKVEHTLSVGGDGQAIATAGSHNAEPLAEDSTASTALAAQRGGTQGQSVAPVTLHKRHGHELSSEEFESETAV